MFDPLYGSQAPQNHVMTFFGRGNEGPVAEKATVNFTPKSISLHAHDAAPGAPLVLKQILIRGQPQLRGPVPDFALRQRHVHQYGPSGFGAPSSFELSFQPILDSVGIGDEISVEVEPAGARFTFVMYGHLDLEDYVARMIEAGQAIDRRALSISADEIQPNSTAIIQASPQVLFKATSLSVSPECAPFFDVADVRAGKDSLFVTSTPFAATLFPPIPDAATAEERERFDEALRVSIPLVVPGMILSVVVSNTSDEPRDFRGAFHGYAF